MNEFVAEPFTPTTEHIKYAYVQFTRNAFVASTSELEQEFDRWLVQHDEIMWGAGFDEGNDEGRADAYKEMKNAG